MFDIKDIPNYLLEQFCSSCYIFKILCNKTFFLSEETEVKKAKYSYWPALLQVR